MHMLYFLRLTFFSKALLDACVCMQRFDFKNIIMAIKLFLVMILNLNLTSEQSQKGLLKSDFVVAVL